MTGNMLDMPEPRSPGRDWSPVDEICAERQRQNNKWGEQNYPSIMPGPRGESACHAYHIPGERQCKLTVERLAHAGILTWADVLLEEFAEAVAAPDDAERRAELVQVAAVALAWMECIDQRASPREVTP